MKKFLRKKLLANRLALMAFVSLSLVRAQGIPPVAAICRDANLGMLYREMEYTKKELHLPTTATPLLHERWAELENELGRLDGHIRYVVDWLLLSSPNSRGGSILFQDRIQHLEEDYWSPVVHRLAPHSPGSFYWKDELRWGADHAPLPYTAEMNQYSDEIMKRPTKDDWDEKIRSAKSKASLVCLGLKIPKCRQAFHETLDLMHPGVLGGSTYSLFSTYRAFLKNPANVRGAALAALKISERIENNDLSGDLFSDIQAAYIETGSTKSEAEEYAYDLLGIYATRGASVSYHNNIFHFGNRHLGLALAVLSLGINVLDQRRLEAGINPYSYPSSMKTSCYMAKPYHFWMPAYFAHYLLKRGYPLLTAQMVPYLLDVTYQMNSDTWTRDPDLPFRNSLYDAFNNSIRMDLSFSLQGATFGASGALTRDLDQWIVELFQAARPFPESDPQEVMKKVKRSFATRMKYWNMRFQPLLHTPLEAFGKSSMEKTLR